MIFEVDGQPVTNRRQVLDILSGAIGRQVSVKVWRRTFSGDDYTEQDLQLTITPEKAAKGDSTSLFGGGW